MVEHELVNPFVRIDGMMESVLGLSPKLLTSLWDRINDKKETSRKRKLETGSEPQPKSKAKVASADIAVADSHCIDVGSKGGDGAKKSPN